MCGRLAHVCMMSYHHADSEFLVYCRLSDIIYACAMSDNGPIMLRSVPIMLNGASIHKKLCLQWRRKIFHSRGANVSGLVNLF